jgi:hypothetical protein
MTFSIEYNKKFVTSSELSEKILFPGNSDFHLPESRNLFGNVFNPQVFKDYFQISFYKQLKLLLI